MTLDDADKKVLVICACVLAGSILVIAAFAIFRGRRACRSRHPCRYPDLEPVLDSPSRISAPRRANRSTRANQVRRARSGQDFPDHPPINRPVSPTTSSTEDLVCKKPFGPRERVTQAAISPERNDEVESSGEEPELSHNWVRHLSAIIEAPSSPPETSMTHQSSSGSPSLPARPRGPFRDSIRDMDESLCHSRASDYVSGDESSSLQLSTLSLVAKRPLSIDAGLTEAARRTTNVRHPSIRERSISSGAEIAGPAPVGSPPLLPSHVETGDRSPQPEKGHRKHHINQPEAVESGVGSIGLVASPDQAHIEVRPRTNRSRISVVSWTTNSPDLKVQNRVADLVSTTCVDGQKQHETRDDVPMSPVRSRSTMPSALRGSPTARQGPRPPACVRISLLAPTVLGCSDSGWNSDHRPSSPELCGISVQIASNDRFCGDDIAEGESTPAPGLVARKRSRPSIARRTVARETPATVITEQGSIHMSREASLIDMPPFVPALMHKSPKIGQNGVNITTPRRTALVELERQCDRPSSYTPGQAETISTTMSRMDRINDHASIDEDALPASPPFSSPTAYGLDRQYSLASLDGMTVLSNPVRPLEERRLRSSPVSPAFSSPDKENTLVSSKRSGSGRLKYSRDGYSPTPGRQIHAARRKASLIGPRASPGPKVLRTVNALRRMNSDVQTSILDAPGRRYMSLGREVSPFILETLAPSSDDDTEVCGDLTWTIGPTNQSCSASRARRSSTTRRMRELRVWSDDRGKIYPLMIKTPSAARDLDPNTTSDDDRFWNQVNTPLWQQANRRLWSAARVSDDDDNDDRKTTDMFQTPRVQVTDESGRVTTSVSGMADDGGMAGSPMTGQTSWDSDLITMRHPEGASLRSRQMAAVEMGNTTFYDADGFLMT